MRKKNVLIVEDAREISDLIALYMADISDVQVIQVETGEAALDTIAGQDIDLMILDISLPQMNGYAVLQNVREVGASPRLPVIIVSSKTQDNEIILGLNLGADDYVSKPFNPLELVARAKAQLRRTDSSGDSSDGAIRIGELELNTRTCVLTKNGMAIDLTYTEYNLLKHFMDAPKRVFTKRQLFASVWKDDEAVYFENTVMVYISKLREKIEDDPKNPKYIKTVRGLGYRFETE